MINFTISVTDIEDAIALEQWGIVDAHISYAEDTIKSGGKVIFERKYENAPSETLLVISTEEDLAQWKEKVSKVISILKNQER